MSKYGADVDEPYAHVGRVKLRVSDYDGSAVTGLSPDEARLLGLRLIKTADEAEAQEW
ncbi:hypothetical protein ABT096_29730 [Streptomyces sp. NPDC002561]|uniref:hypothetical protein n=1 Tax=Streptomyces sp. NPDC002561 TaxID=3154418 RepID=UPI00332A5F19